MHNAFFRVGVVLPLLAASLLNIAPLAFFNIAGDITSHRIIMDCFATQFWQGDFYPRWCMDSNSGLGAPVFTFYFPLPYYVTALLWPLTWFGANSYQVYIIACLLATLATAFTCYSWLKDSFAPRYALLASVLFLFMPYRMEALLFRSAYAELWGMAFLPLVFKYARLLIPLPVGMKLGGGQSCTGEQEGPLPNPLPQAGEGMLKLALSFALLLLSHVPAATAAALGSGVYMLVMAWDNRRAWIRYGAAMVWGAAMAAFFVVPAVYYKQFINAFYTAPQPWPNTYLDVDWLMEPPHFRMGFVILLNLFAGGLLMVWLLLKARHNPTAPCREMAAWAIIFCIGLFFFLRVSAPFYDHLLLHEVTLPWRMQNLFAPAVVFMLATWMQHLASPRQRRHWKTDFALMFALLAVLGQFLMATRISDNQRSERWQLVTHYVLYPTQYQTVWTGADRYTDEAMYRRSRSARRPLAIVAGKGNVQVRHWGWDGISVESDAQTPLTLRLDHTYFPEWSAADAQGHALNLYPETPSGKMLLDIPAGRHVAMLHYSIFQGSPLLLKGSYGLSLLALAAWLVFYRKGQAHAGA